MSEQTEQMAWYFERAQSFGGYAAMGAIAARGRSKRSPRDSAEIEQIYQNARVAGHFGRRCLFESLAAETGVLNGRAVFADVEA